MTNCFSSVAFDSFVTCRNHPKLCVKSETRQISHCSGPEQNHHLCGELVMDVL